MAGLRRDIVRVVKHDPNWESLFQAECESIRRAARELILDVQHVGSTAVKDLPAKPIVDIAVAVQSQKTIPHLVRRLTAIGYIDRGDRGREGGHLLGRESEPAIRTVHLHMVERSDAQWRNYINFRDTLRQNPFVRREYAELKRQLCVRFAGNRRAYTESKNDFIRRVLNACGEALHPVAAHPPVPEGKP